MLCWPHASGLSLCLCPSRRSESSFPGQGARRSQRGVGVRVQEVPSVGFPSWAFRPSDSVPPSRPSFFCLQLLSRSVKRRVLSFALSSRARGVLLRWVARVVLSFLASLLVCGVSAWVTPGCLPFDLARRHSVSGLVSGFLPFRLTSPAALVPRRPGYSPRLFSRGFSPSFSVFL